MSRADKYLIPSGVAFLGGVLIIAPLFIKAPSDYATYAAKDALEQSETINRWRIQERGKTAEVIRQTGLLPEGSTVRIIDYDDSIKRPRLKKQTLQHYLEDQVVHVYDRSGVCIGKIQKRRFIWKRDDNFACNDAPVISEEGS